MRTSCRRSRFHRKSALAVGEHLFKLKHSDGRSVLVVMRRPIPQSRKAELTFQLRRDEKSRVRIKITWGSGRLVSGV
jgi:hypothetical protein